MVRVGIGVECPFGEFSVPLYNGRDGRSVLTVNPIAISFGDYRLEPAISITTGDLESLYRRIFG